MNRFSFALRVLIQGVPTAAAPVGEPAAPVIPPSAPASAPADLDIDPAALDEPTTVVEPAPLAERAVPTPSETVQQLISLRDKVLLAADQPMPVGPAAMASVARQLGQILALERVVAVEDEGGFDATRQRVVDILETEDPAQDYRVASSVRPGYLQDGELLRHQEVVVFRCDDESGDGHG